MKRLLYTLSGLGFFLMISGCSQQEQSITSPQGKVKHEIITLAPKVPGRVVKILVSEGQVVKKGDTLAILEAPEISAKMQQADGAVEGAQWQLNMTKNGATEEQLAQIDGQTEAAREQVAFAEKSHERMYNMYIDSLIPAQQYDEVKTKYEAAKAQLKSLEAKRLEIIKGARKEQLGMAKSQLDRAKGAKLEVEIADNERFLLAPANMRIETITLKQGELALPGYTLFSGYENETTYFRFTVSESLINKYKTGQDIIVEIPYVNKTVHCKLQSVKELPRYADNTSASPNYKLGESLFELKIVPVDKSDVADVYHNSTVLLKN